MTIHCTITTVYPERTRDLAKLLMGISIQALKDPQFVASFVQNPAEIPQLIEDANEAIQLIAEVYDFFPFQLENELGMTEAVRKINERFTSFKNGEFEWADAELARGCGSCG